MNKKYFISFLLFSLTIIIIFLLIKNYKASKLAKVPEGKDQSKEYTAVIKKLEAEKPVAFAKEDLSPEGFNYIHYDFARFLSRTVYTHNYDEEIRKDSALQKRDILEEYLKSLQLIKKESFEKWEKIHQKSFLINTYHAYLIDFMMKKKFKLLNDKDLAIEGTIKVFEQVFSFNFFIEKEILKRFPEPSIILTLHCFSQSCPEYRSRVVNYKNIEQELKVSVNRYFRHPDKVIYNYVNKSIVMPSYVGKYKNYFPHDQKSWIDFLESVFPEKSKQRDLISDKNLKIVFSNNKL